MKSPIPIIILLILPLFMQAQNLFYKGDLRDETGRTLRKVLVTQGSTGYIFYSDDKGNFQVPATKKPDTLHFSFDGFESIAVRFEAGASQRIVLKRSSLNGSRINRRASLTPRLRFEAQQQWFTGDETYASTVHNGFVAAQLYPATALSLNVDKASYSNVRRLLNEKNPVPQEAVRLEELLNYFNLAYTIPANGKTFELQTVLTTCPWNSANQLLLATLHTKKVPVDSLPPSHFVFLIDASASMDAPNRLPLLKAGFRGLVENLRAQDSVSIVVYGGTVGVYLPTTSGADKKKIIHAIDSLQTGGSTPGESGVRLAYAVARNHFIQKGNNRVILATDGDFNVGLRTDNDLEQLIREQRKSGVYLTCLGVGMGNYKDAKIQTLAQYGNGNFGYIDTYAEAEKILMKEFMQTLYTVADDARLQVQFNPEYVKQYRLLGFDNRVGAIKDTLSVVEGRELGSGFSLLVAFEIQPVKNAGVHITPAQFKLSYRQPRKLREEVQDFTPVVNLVPFAQIEKPFQFAGALLLFGGLLHESPYIKDKSWSDVLTIVQKCMDTSDPAQKEFPAIVEKAKAVYGGKKKKKPVL